MSYPARVKTRLKERLSLRHKFLLKRLFVGVVSAALRLGARGYNFGAYVLHIATKHGLDLHRAWPVPPKGHAPAAQPWTTEDFLFLMDKVAAARHVAPAAHDAVPAAEQISAAPALAAAESAAASAHIRASIIIPVYNKVEFTFQCLRSLLKELDFKRDEVIVVNNASQDETARVLAHFAGLVRIVTNETNLGFVDACNLGAAQARGRYLVFLNNDTVVLPGWLDELVGTVERDDTVGAAGSLFLYPNGLIQEAGAILWRDGHAFHYGWGAAADDRRYNFAREVDYCSGASLLIRTELFAQLGGFDRRFAPAYYEDCDLCMGVRALGHKVVYQPASRLVHYEGATAGRDTGTGIKRFQVVNRTKFVEKWRDVLAREHLPHAADLVEQAANRKRAPRVVVFDERVPTPDRDAGSARMFFILQTLARWSRPLFVPMNRPERPDYERLLWRAGIETASLVAYPRLLRGEPVYAAVVSRPAVADALLPVLRRRHPGVKLVFDMVDAHFVRFEREHAVTGDPNIAAAAARYRTLETRLARLSDLVWCNSTEDKRVVAAAAPGVPIEVIPTIHQPHAAGPPFAARRGLLFIGNLFHRPNADGIHYYMREVHPLVRRALPEVELYIVGDNDGRELAGYGAEPGVHLLGYVPDVEPLWQTRRVFVAPLRYGAGVKGKIGEALAHGLPVITTPVGAEGMGLETGTSAIIAATPAAFAAAVVETYTQPELWQRLAAQGRAHVAANFSPHVVGALINDSLKALGAQTADVRRAATTHVAAR